MNTEISALQPRDLQYLIAIADNRSFLKAARACAVTQPALSAQVKKVEELFGVRLFQRGSREVSLTRSGAAIVAQARVALQELERLGSIARRLPNPFSGVFRLGVVSSIASAVVLDSLAPLIAKFENLELVVSEGPMQALAVELQNGEIDALFGTNWKPTKEIRRLFVAEEEFIVLLSRRAEGSLPKRPKLKDLSVTDMIFLDSQHSLTDQTFKMLGLKVDQAVLRDAYALDLASLLGLVVTARKYAVIPKTSSNITSAVEGLAELRRFAAPAPKRSLYLFWPKGLGTERSYEELALILKRSVAAIARS